ncbi:MAG: DUF5683 domain-containing protein [Bacteroidia bacterium]|nr:DUF5683 domain-containing protein [Bacteroidia bacterium]
MKRRILLALVLMASLGLQAQTDSLTQIIMADTVNAMRPAWYRDSVKQKKTPIYSKAWEYVDEELLPKLTEEDDKLKLTIKIPWREDVVVPYFPKGLLPADSPPPYDPEVAWQRSTVIPGLGQIYNNAGWKVPIFWAGYGAAAWWINYNQSRYQRFGRAYSWAVDDDPATEDSELALRYDASGLRTARNNFRQQRDNGFLILLGWHGLQILEAYVDAHLNDFDVSEDLSIRWSPVIDPNGLGLAFTF